MYTVYLDWNIITRLKNSPNVSIEKFNEIREVYKDYLIFPYSSAHIQDLRKGFDKEVNHDIIKQDLDLLNTLSKGYYLELDFKTQKVIPSIGDTHVVFESYSENDTSDLLNPDKILSSFDDLEMGAIGNLFKTKWKLTPVDIDFSQFDNHPESKEIYDNYFPRTRKENNLYNFMLDWSEFMNDLNTKPQLYNKLREAFRESVGLESREVSNFSDPIQKLNDLLLNSNIKKSFKELSSLDYIEDTKTNQFLKSDLAKFCIAYANLDMAGFRPDKFTSKNVYQNFTNDSHHAYYGGYCDFFVSNEKKLVAKANVLYKEFHTETKAFILNDFIQEIEQIIVKECDAVSFFSSVNDALKNDFYQIHKIPEDDGNDIEILIFKPKHPIFNYFNFLYTENKPNSNHKFFYLRHVNLNYANFNFFDAIASIVNKCLNAFGVDLEKIGEFNENDVEELRRKDWKGRQWILGEYFIYFMKDDASSGVKLVFEHIDDEFINGIKQNS